MPATKNTEYIQLDEFVLECDSIEDSFEKAIARYEFPYRDGALLEDMGQKARKVKFRCYFLGELYPLHIGFLNHLEKNTLFDLHHPKYGLLKGCIETATVKHDDRQQTAEIDVNFVENMRGQSEFFVEPLIRPDVKSQAEDLCDAGIADQADEFAGDMRSDFASAGLPAGEVGTLLAMPIAPELSILEQVTSVSGAVRDYVKEIDARVREFEALLTDAANPANSLIATIEFSANLPGRVIGSVTRLVERYSVAMNSLVAFPARFLSSLAKELDALMETIENSPIKGKAQGAARATMIKHLRIARTQRLALEAAYLYKSDEEKRAAVRSAETTRSFDAFGNYVKTAQLDPILSANELEETLASVRGRIQESVSTARGMNSLKGTAKALLEYVNTIKLEREKIKRIELDSTMPLHLVCIKYGLPYNAAERLLAINKIPAPNFTKGAMDIYAG